MRHIVTVATFLMIVALDFPSAAQFPGQYPSGPGSPYPGRSPTGSGIPIPRRGKDKKTEQSSKQQPELHSLTGVLREIDGTSVTIVAQDTRTITARRTAAMKVFRMGEEISPSALAKGDRIRIEATQDEQGFFHAVAIHLESEGTANDKTAAEGGAASSTQRASDNDERPVIRRKPAATEKRVEAEAEMKAADASADEEPPARKVVIAEGDANALDPDRPRQRRDKPVALNRASRAEAAASGQRAPALPDTRSTPSPEPQTVAANRSAVPSRELEPATAAREDERITKAREAVAAYTQSLPNYFCQVNITRFTSTTQKVDWRPLDVITATVVFERGRDRYRNITVNGKPVDKGFEELGGAWSTGEFGIIGADLFSPATATEFTSKGSSRIAGHDAIAYDFLVDRENSHWHIQAPSQSIRPAYKGTVWLKTDSAAILRIEMQTRGMPKEFPFDKVESAVDYEFVRLGQQQFLLPVHAESLTCVRGTSNCSRNVIDFRNYRKYSGESTITFEN